MFDSGTNEQSVNLVTLIQDAVFLYPSRDDEGNYETIPIGVDENGEPISGRGFFLDDTELSWTAEKPYVIYGYAGVPPGETLNIAPERAYISFWISLDCLQRKFNQNKRCTIYF